MCTEQQASNRADNLNLPILLDKTCGEVLYLVDGSDDLPGLLVEGVGTPVRVEIMELFDQTVVFSQEECVQDHHAEMLIGS